MDVYCISIFIILYGLACHQCVLGNHVLFYLASRDNIFCLFCSVLAAYVRNLHTLQVTPNLIKRSIDIQL